jgi:hypothetical protein
MATVSSGMTDLELLHRLLGAELARGGRSRPVDEDLTGFRQYLADVERLREEIRPALERSLRGETKPFGPEEVMARQEQVMRRINALGIPE